MEHPTLVLTGSDVRDLLDLDDCITAVEEVFGLQAAGKVPPPAALGVHVPGGGFHIKAASAELGRHYFAAKTNGNFPGNPSRHGLPTIQGVLVLCDATDGRVLALMDSMEITTLRTGAATGVAAKHLARAGGAVATIVGCGIQGRVQLRALSRVMPLEHVFAIDADDSSAGRYAADMTLELGVRVAATRDLADAVRQSDACVTCTPSREAFLGPEHVRAGAFVAAVGADHPEKHEIEPHLLAESTVVVDALQQCLSFGDLHHAVDAGVMTVEAVHAELGEIVNGTKPGRTSDEEVIVFDSTGTALQDVAAAALAYERALADGRGRTIRLGVSGASRV